MEELMLQQIAILEQIAFDVRIILLFSVLGFCTASFRSWRNTVIRGVE